MEPASRIAVPTGVDEANDILRGLNTVLNCDTFKMTPEAHRDFEIRCAMVETALALLIEDEEGLMMTVEHRERAAREKRAEDALVVLFCGDEKTLNNDGDSAVQ